MPKKEKKEKTPAAPATAQQQDSSTEPTDDGEEEVEEKKKGSKLDGSDISKVTDFVEEKALDSARASQAVASIAADVAVDRAAELERERMLAAVSIDRVRPCSVSPWPSCALAEFLSSPPPNPCARRRTST